MKKKTLDSFHKQTLKSFDNKEKDIPNIEKKIKKIEKEYMKLIKKENKKCSEKEIVKKFELNKKINELKNEKEEILKSKQEYYLSTMEHLTKYYYNIDINIEYCETKQEQSPKKEKSNDNKNGTIFDFFKNDNQNKSNLTDFISKEDKINKKDIYENYLTTLNKNTDDKVDYVKNYTYCFNCDQDKVFVSSEALYVCEKCGECDTILVENTKSSYKEPPKDVCVFNYKRETHFIEGLNLFQALESTNIPDDVYEAVMNEIKKERIQDLKKITRSKLRSILKKIGHSKYFDNIPSLLRKINGRPPPKLNKELEEKLKIMFKEIQEPFNKVCPPTRVNFLSYSFVYRKFFELLDEQDFIDEFPILKSREKLYDQDMIWKKMCVILNWPYIPSI
jgi:hypothetical protein